MRPAERGPAEETSVNASRVDNAARRCPIRWSRRTCASATPNVALTSARSCGSSIVHRPSAVGGRTFPLPSGEFADEVPVGIASERPQGLLDQLRVIDGQRGAVSDVDQRLLDRRHPTGPHFGLCSLQVECRQVAFHEVDPTTVHHAIRSLLWYGNCRDGQLPWHETEDACGAEMHQGRAVDAIVCLGDSHRCGMQIRAPPLVTDAMLRHACVVSTREWDEQPGGRETAKLRPGLGIDAGGILGSHHPLGAACDDGRQAGRFSSYD